MNLLIVDNCAEAQSKVVRRIESFSSKDVEMLDIRIKLALDTEFVEQVFGADVLILGSSLGEAAPQIARSATAAKNNIHIIMFVTEDYYSGGAFREAHSAGVRKVFSDSAQSLDLLQELVSVFSEFRREGKVRKGRLVCVTHAKGGTGATTICAALAEVCSIHQKRTLLWDLDVETRDLCRALTVSGDEALIVNEWVAGTLEVSRDTLSRAVVAVSDEVSVLMPPTTLRDSLDLVCHTDGMALCEQIIDVARVVNDVIIVDTAGKLSPATAALLRMADEVLVVIDDTILGLTALDLFLTYAKSLVYSPDRITFLVNGYSGSFLAVPQIEAELEPVHHLGPKPWRLPPVPVDPGAASWPGSGRGFFRLGQQETRASLEEIAAGLELVDIAISSYEQRPKLGKWWEKLLRKEDEVGRVESQKPRLALPNLERPTE